MISYNDYGHTPLYNGVVVSGEYRMLYVTTWLLTNQRGDLWVLKKGNTSLLVI